MTWEAFLLLLNLNAKAYCDSLFIQESNCVESVVECVLDGESFEWCTSEGVNKQGSEVGE